MISVLIVIAVVLALFAFRRFITRNKSGIAESMREVTSLDSWDPFYRGYKQALQDMNDTGLIPKTAESKKASAARAFRKHYIER